MTRPHPSQDRSESAALRGRTIGAVLAGGQSRRFGSDKAFASIAGRPIIEWVVAAHRASLPALVLVTNYPEPFRHFDLPIVPDVYPGAGPLAGIHAALRFARDNGAAGICCTPCDAPFVNARLLLLLVDASLRSGVHAVLPESDGPLGYEPLFAWYGVDVLPALEAALEAGHGAVHEFVDSLENKDFVPRARVSAAGAPELLFLNVNTPSDLNRASQAFSALDSGVGVTPSAPRNHSGES